MLNIVSYLYTLFFTYLVSVSPYFLESSKQGRSKPNRSKFSPAVPGQKKTQEDSKEPRKPTAENSPEDKGTKQIQRTFRPDKLQTKKSKTNQVKPENVKYSETNVISDKQVS